MSADVSLSMWAQNTFGDGFFKAGVLKREHRRESALSLAYAVISRDFAVGQLRAFALAIRHISDLHSDSGAMSPEQISALHSLAGEAALPAAFGELVTTLLSLVKTTEELSAFYGVLSGAEEAYQAIFRARESALRK